MGTRQATEPLAALLGDPDVGVNAASALAHMGDARGLDILIDCLRSYQGNEDEEDGYYGYWDPVSKLGIAAVEPLLDIAASASAVARQEALRLIGEIGDPSAIDALTALEVLPELALDVLAARGECGDLSMLDPLIKALKDGLTRAHGTYHRIPEALGALGEPAIPLLAAIVEDQNSPAREEAADALSLSGCESAIEPLAKLLHDPDPELRVEAVGGLGELAQSNCALFGRICLGLLKPVTQDEDCSVGEEAASYIERIQHDLQDTSLDLDN